MSRQRNTEELLRTVEVHYEQYLKSLRALHEVLTPGRPLGGGSPGGIRMERSGSADSAVSPVMPPSPELKSVQTALSLNESVHSPPAAAKRTRRGTNDMTERLPLEKKHIPVSLYAGDSDAEEEGEFVPLALLPISPPPPLPERGVPCVQRVLTPYSYTDAELVSHIRGLPEPTNAPNGTVLALDEVWKKRQEVTVENVFNAQTYGSVEHQLLYANATYEVYDIGRDAVAAQQHDNSGNADGQNLESRTVWDTLKSAGQERNAVGRMTILQEPSPLMLAVTHKAMGKHFDMDELYQHLVTTDGNKGKTKAFMYRAFEASDIRRRTFFFVFKYYTVVSPEMAPAPWQQYDQRTPERRDQDHIDIAECSSVLALSLEGPPMKEIQLQYRKKKPKQNGQVFNPSAPWHLLSIQSFPDSRHSIRSEDISKPFYNGPYAFLDSLAVEYRDAVKRLSKLHEHIVKLTTPQNQFMFDPKLRDKLLFEDSNFTFSRRYFWAYNTLGVINEGIKAMIAAYADTFTPDFWAGRHRVIWPLEDPGSPEAADYLRTLAGLRDEISRAVDDLHRVFDRNERTRKDIANLREQLFSGSSVRESRRAVEQGDNIKILTSVSMIFLPLTFVTSVFGITEFTIPANDWRFPVVMICVCVPFFVLIVLLQTHKSMKLLRKAGSAAERLFSSGRGNDRFEMLAAKQKKEAAAQGRRPLDDRFGGLGALRWRWWVDMAAVVGDGSTRPWWRIRRKKAAAGLENGSGSGDDIV